MTKVRFVVLKGKRQGSELPYHDRVECAVRSDGSSPAKDFWITLKDGAWPSGYAAYVHPDSDVVDEFYKVLGKLKRLVHTGLPIYEGASRYLMDGVWEIVHSRIRIPYFDVDENGYNSPKAPRTDRAAVDSEGIDDLWKYPDMDLVLRLTHGFIKHGDSHPEEYALALQIRTEDLV
jgi:hypothetical protein